MGQIDHDLDNLYHLDPNLPLGYVVQDMCSTDPTLQHEVLKILQIRKVSALKDLL